MAKNKHIADSLDARMSALAATLPECESKLLELARQTVNALNTAVMEGDETGAKKSSDLYDAVCYKMNGNTFKGCSVGNPSVRQRIEDYCSAVPGTVPLWGQAGEFMLDMGVYRLWVKCSTKFGMWMPHFEFFAVDLNRPFLSETGYRSVFASFAGKATVEEAARTLAKAMPLRKIEDGYRNDYAARPLPVWLQAVTPPAFRKATQEAQTALDGFEKVDVLLPPYQAYIARKWAEEAQLDLFGKD